MHDALLRTFLNAVHVIPGFSFAADSVSMLIVIVKCEATRLLGMLWLAAAVSSSGSGWVRLATDSRVRHLNYFKMKLVFVAEFRVALVQQGWIRHVKLCQRVLPVPAQGGVCFCHVCLGTWKRAWILHSCLVVSDHAISLHLLNLLSISVQKC